MLQKNEWKGYLQNNILSQIPILHYLNFKFYLISEWMKEENKIIVIFIFKLIWVDSWLY